MRYLVNVLHDRPDAATADETAAIDAFDERLQTDGHWVFAGGLASPDSSTVVDGRGEEMVLTDGPCVESREWSSGFWVLEALDLDVALRLAAAGSRACHRRVEVRPFL